jgi:hypothetical protein
LVIQGYLDPSLVFRSTQNAPLAIATPVVEGIDVTKTPARCNEWRSSGARTWTIPRADLLQSTLSWHQSPLSALVRPNYAPHLTGPERSEPGERGRGDLEQIEDELLSGVELRIEALNEQAVLS